MFQPKNTNFKQNNLRKRSTEFIYSFASSNINPHELIMTKVRININL